MRMSKPPCLLIVFSLLLSCSLAQSQDPEPASQTWPFPGQKDTRLPEIRAKNVRTQILHTDQGKRFRFLYQASDGVMEFCLEPSEVFWGSTIVKINRIPVGTALAGAAPTFETPIEGVQLIRAWVDGDTARAQWKGFVGGQEVLIESALRLWQKTLVVDFVCRGGSATGLSYGQITDIREAELLKVPLPASTQLVPVIQGGGVRPCFASVWGHPRDPSLAIPVEAGAHIEDGAWIGGGIRILPDPSGKRSDLVERFLVTFSETLEETLPPAPIPGVEESQAGKVSDR